MHKQIIIIPGIMGSKLKCREYSVWPPLMGALIKGKEQYNEKLRDIDSGEIESTGLISFFYKSLKNCCEQIITEDDEVVEFGYDWRKNNFTHIEELEQVINLDADEVIIIAHSMGGIVAKLFLNTCKNAGVVSKVSKLITLGTPWKGSVDAYKNLKFGLQITLMHLFKSVIPYYESIYQLLPNEDYTNKSGEDFGYKYLDGKGWDQIREGYYKPLLKDYDLNYHKVLERYYEVMKEDLPDTIEHHEIVGYGYGTLTSINFVGEQVTAKYGFGDGTVPIYSAKSNTIHKYYVEENHQGLPKNKTVHNIIERIINKNEESDQIVKELGLDDYETIINRGNKFKVVKVACPVNISVTDENGEVVYGDISQMKSDNLLELFFEEQLGVQYLNNDTYLILDENKDIKNLHVEAYEKGTVSISIDEYESGELQKTVKFKTFNMNHSNAVDITINDVIEECEIKLDEKVIESVVVENKDIAESIELPRTKYKVMGDTLKPIGEKEYIAADNVSVCIENVEEGTYKIMNTLYSINGKQNSVIDADSVVLELEEGKNVIRLYSIDIYSNMEETQELTIYYIGDSSNRIPKLQIKAQPDIYEINAEFVENKAFDNLGLPESMYTINFKDEAGVTGNVIENKGISRSFYLTVKDIFGEIESDKFNIDENLLSLIVESKASIGDYKKVLNGIGINADEIRFYRMKRNNKVATYRLLNVTKLSDADEIEFFNDKMSISIDKKKEYRIMFSNLTEYIDIGGDKKHIFEFSVFSRVNVKKSDVKLDISLAIESNSNATQYSTLKELSYEIIDDKYKFIIDTNEVWKILYGKEYISNEIKEIYVLIRLEDKDGEILRACQLKIK